MSRSFLVACAAAVLPGCAVQIYGGQTVGTTVSVVVTGGAAAASRTDAGARVSFVSGTPVPAGAPGGQLTVSSGGAGGAILVGVLVAEFLNAIGAVAPPGRKPLAPDTRIMHTCSCYGYQPGGAERRGKSSEESGEPR